MTDPLFDPSWVCSPPAAQGPQGEKGDTGDTGPKGDPGDTGDDGAPGAPGTPGTDGEDGADGANCYDNIGTTTADCIGPPGETGPPGDAICSRAQLPRW